MDEIRDMNENEVHFELQKPILVRRRAMPAQAFKVAGTLLVKTSEGTVMASPGDIVVLEDNMLEVYNIADGFEQYFEVVDGEEGF